MNRGNKSLGIIGGMGSHASVWLLQRIVGLSGIRKDQDYPEIFVHNNTRIPDRTTAIVAGGESPVHELRRSVDIFNACGIEVALLGCMTAYYYYDDLCCRFKGQLLDAPEIVSSAIARIGRHRKIGLIGSTGLIESGMFQRRLRSQGYDVLVLESAEQERYFMGPVYRENGIKAGVVDGEVKMLFSKQIELLMEKGADLIVGACSEVPLVLDDVREVAFIDAFDLLARTAVEICYNKSLQ